jgi:hypothetical protein
LPARRLIVVYAALLALLDASVLLPGDPQSTAWGSAGAVAVQTLLVWGLWRGSALAWVLALAMALLTVLALFLMAVNAESGVIFLFVFLLTQAIVLCTRPIRASVWSRGGKPLASG